MLHCRMEEMVMLQYGSFSALSEWAKVLTQSTSCSHRATKHVLGFQLFLDEMRKINSNWSATHRQEWVYSSWSVCSTPLPPWGGGRGSSIETDIPTPTIQRWLRKWPQSILLWEACWGHLRKISWKLLRRCTRGSMSSLPVNSLTGNRRSTWQSYMLSSVSAWLELASWIC